MAGRSPFPEAGCGLPSSRYRRPCSEANEEIGLDCSGVEVIGELSPLTTRLSPALVYCFVGTFPGPGPGGRALSADVSEVDKVFWAALAVLAADEVFHEELWPAPSGGDGARAEALPVYRPVPFFVLGDEVVWGAPGGCWSSCWTTYWPLGAREAFEKVPWSTDDLSPVRSHERGQQGHLQPLLGFSRPSGTPGGPAAGSGAHHQAR